jgi:hypothetical protein
MNMIESRREVAGKVSIETRYDIGSIGPSAACGHWGIEN